MGYSRLVMGSGCEGIATYKTEEERELAEKDLKAVELSLPWAVGSVEELEMVRARAERLLEKMRVGGQTALRKRKEKEEMMREIEREMERRGER